MTNLDKWSILAGLRFLLASVVAFAHLASFTGLGFLSFIPLFGKFEAVLGFLLISGYSITVSYLKEPKKQFIFRRFKRIYPTYIASVLITFLVVTLVMRQRAPAPGFLIANALLLNQLFTFDSFVQPAWSLSLEFWLYCLAPALVLARPRWTRACVYVSFVSYLLYTAGRTLLHLPYFSAVGYGGNLLLLSFVWICGLRLARDPDNPGPALWDLRVIFTGHIALGAAIQWLSRIKHHQGEMFLRADALAIVVRAATLCLVYFVFTRYVLPPRVARQRSNLLRFLGDISYPLYLLNITVYSLVSRVPLLRQASVYYLTALLASAALYWMVDVYSKRRHLKLPPA